MARRICLALAIASGLCALVLLQTSPSIESGGATVECGSMVVDWESGLPAGSRHAAACDAKRTEWSLLAGLAALVCAGAGSYVKFGGRDDNGGTPPRVAAAPVAT